MNRTQFYSRSPKKNNTEYVDIWFFK